MTRLPVDSPSVLFVSAPGYSIFCRGQIRPFTSPTQPYRRAIVYKSASQARMIAGTDSLNLPPALRKYVDAFASVPDPKLRYQQLLFFAKQLPLMDESLKTDENRVQGCTSVVHVHVSLDKDGLVKIEGDSDAQLTKGLLALLVNGLGGTEPEKIASVDPEFISSSGLSVSLTPSRNNGFVNMLAKIKQKVAALVEGEAGEVPAPEAVEDLDYVDRPIYSAITRKLSALKPVTLEVVDNSAQHAGHAEAQGLGGGESHFIVSIVADAFDSLDLVQRHRLIYTLLSEEMGSGGLHALKIDAKTPQEASM